MLRRFRSDGPGSNFTVVLCAALTDANQRLKHLLCGLTVLVITVPTTYTTLSTDSAGSARAIEITTVVTAPPTSSPTNVDTGNKTEELALAIVFGVAGFIATCIGVYWTWKSAVWQKLRG